MRNAESSSKESVLAIHASDRVPYQITLVDSEVNEWAKTAMDPLVIHVQLGSKVVRRVLVDSASSSDILYWDAFKKLGFEQNNLRPTTCTLVGFEGERVKAL